MRASTTLLFVCFKQILNQFILSKSSVSLKLKIPIRPYQEENAWCVVAARFNIKWKNRHKISGVRWGAI